MIEVGWLTIDSNFWTDLVRFAAPGAVLLFAVWVLLGSPHDLFKTAR